MKKIIFALCALAVSSAMASSDDLYNHQFEYTPESLEHGVELKSPTVDGVAMNGAEDMLVVTNQMCAVSTSGQYKNSLYSSAKVKSQKAMGLSEDGQSFAAKQTMSVIISIVCY